jgi:hypothetical protein
MVSGWVSGRVAVATMGAAPFVRGLIALTVPEIPEDVAPAQAASGAL